MDIKNLFGSEMDRYPINKPPEIVYGAGGKVLGYYLEDSVGNRQYINVKNKKDMKKLKEEVKKEILEKDNVEMMDGLTLYFFKDHSLFQLINMINSGKFKDVEFQIKLAISMYDILNKYLNKVSKNIKV